MAHIGRYLPQGIQEKGKEIRTFMPRYGCINERRNQLHEVIRLSGMNLIINDTDHPLIIKVASIQSARMQVYFIDKRSIRNGKKIKMGSGPDLLPGLVHRFSASVSEKGIQRRSDIRSF